VSLFLLRLTILILEQARTRRASSGIVTINLTIDTG